MDRREKEAFVSDLRSALESAEVVIVSRQTGLTVQQSSDLRTQMFQNKGHFKIAKNTLARIAITDLPCEGIKQFLKGPTALSFSKDPIAAAKVIAKYAKTNDKIEILGGTLGDRILSKEAVLQLAELPSLDELRGKIIGVVQAPASKLVRLMLEPAAQLARLMSAKSKQ